MATLEASGRRQLPDRHPGDLRHRVPVLVVKEEAVTTELAQQPFDLCAAGPTERTA